MAIDSTESAAPAGSTCRRCGSRTARMRSPPRLRAAKRASATSIPLVVSPPQHYERIRRCPSIREPRRT